MSTVLSECHEGRRVRPSLLVEHARRFLQALWQDGDVREIRVLGGKGPEASGYFDDPEKLLQAATQWDGRANIYITLNPVRPELLDRAPNRLIRKPPKTTADSDILRRSWLFLDIDSVRPPGVSATEAELDQSGKVLDGLIETLRHERLPEPISCLSGNGYYALYPIDLPNTAEAKKLIEQLLASLAARFNTANAHIDTNVANASRLVGLIGSLKMKGTPTDERPHRRSRIMTLPDTFSPVPLALLEAVAGRQATKRAPTSADATPLWQLLDAARLDYRERPEPDAQGITWCQVRVCPFHGADHPYECGVGQAPNGAYAGKCFHDESKSWREWKRALGLGERPTPSRDGASAVPSVRSSRFRRSDSGNAELFASLHSSRLRYDHRRSKWFVWQGHHWEEDADGEVARLALDAVRTRYRDAEAVEDLNQREHEARFAIASENRSRLEALLAQARSLHPITSSGAGWDADPLLLGTDTGVIDLRTGTLRPGRPKDHIRLFTPVTYAEDAPCPRWKQFLDEVFDCDPELIEFVSLAVGYTLTGTTHEQCLFLLHGTGANGKSVFLGVLRKLLGSYAYNAPFSTFELRGRNEISNDVAGLAGMRLVTASETNAGSRLNEARIKALTGGDVITARFLYGENFSFRPEAKFWLAVNHLPLVDDVSVGFWRRVRLIPFQRTFTDTADRHLEERLAGELPGILAWAVRMAGEWQKTGLRPPACVLRATEDYRQISDPFSEFVRDCLSVEEGSLLPAAAAYGAYKSWAAHEGWTERELLSGTKFGSRMSERFQWTKRRGGKLYLDVRLAPDIDGGE